jgi:antitoxin PrlF
MPMKRLAATVTSKGQITVPLEVRRLLGLRSGNKLVFVVDDDGSVRVESRRYPDLESIQGAAGSLPASLPFHELREIAYDERLRAKLGRSARDE